MASTRKTTTTIIKRPKLSRPLVVALSALGLILLAFVGCAVLKGKGKAEPYRTEQVTRGDLTRSVSASGTLEALVTVDVGSQISGQIRDVYVDFNDRVAKGQVMAVLDPQTYVSRDRQGQAQVASDVASRNQAQAQANVARATYDRQLALYKQGWVAKAALDTAEADWKAAQAQVASASAKINQSRAALSSNRVDLSRTNIVAPISGIVVDREIEPGNTVAASLQAPVLFRIAQDLSRMQVKINVDEADIGQVHEGQMVRFTVDAFPDENFTAVVTQVRKQPSTEQNVVAYTVIAQADNPGQKLLPGMTANADIVIEQKRNVTKVPSAALRWQPADQRAQTAPTRSFGGPGFGGPGFGGPPGGGQRQGGSGRQGGFGGQRMLQALSLTPDQEKKIQPIFAAARQKAQAAGDDPQARRQAMQAAMQDAFAQIEPLLNAEQKQKLTVLRAQMAAGGRNAQGMTSGVVYVLRNNKPVALPVMVGGTDGTNTEVVGPLTIGDQVITGGGPKPKVKASSPFGPTSGGGGQTRVRMP